MELPLWTVYKIQGHEHSLLDAIIALTPPSDKIGHGGSDSASLPPAAVRPQEPKRLETNINGSRARLQGRALVPQPSRVVKRPRLELFCNVIDLAYMRLRSFAGFFCN